MRRLFDIERDRIVLIAVAVTVVRLVAAAAIPLTEDEAYYRLWAQHLHFGYYDHPPMIAWWVWAGERFAGDTTLGVRLIAALSTGATTWLVGDLARQAGLGERVAARAALWFNATFLIGLGGLLAIPDAPNSLFWMLTLCCLARTPRDARWWLAAGVAAGLATLSKYSALFMAPGVLLWLAAKPERRAELRRPWPWAAAVLAAAIFAPNVLWNAAHDWMTFGRQFGRVAPAGLHLGHLPELILTQALLLNPLIAAYAVRGVARAWRDRAAAVPDLALPILTGIPFAGYLVLHSLHDRVQGHWPAPLYGGLAICAAAAAEAGAWPALKRFVAPVGLAVAALGLIHMATPSTGSLGVHDPVSALRGWPRFARDVEQRRLEQGADWVGVQSYGVLAQLAATNALHAPALEIFDRARYDLAAPARPDLDRPGLVLDLDRRVVRADLLRCFRSVEPAGSLERGPPDGPLIRYTAFRVEGPKRDVWTLGCPEEIHPGVWR